MEIIKLREQDEFIKLGQAVKEVIQQGRVSVNGEVDTRRGRKLYAGDVAEYNGEQIKIEK